MPDRERDPIKLWFAAAEELGEYIGIRFGHLAAGRSEPEWHFLKHTDFDGIGGLAHLLRQRGADVGRLVQIKHPVRPSLAAILRMAPKYLGPRKSLAWCKLSGATKPSNAAEAPAAVAWHSFDAATTTRIRHACRHAEFTVNSFLLKHLAKAVRPSLQDQSALMPWMIPVNLRGKVNRPSDEENHSSYVSVKIGAYDTVHDVHRHIYQSIAHGEHWANWFSYKTGTLIPAAARRFAIRTGRAVSQWNVGGFSNLGNWDADKANRDPRCLGDWYFSPPVLRCQMIGAGCVTFQNRLSLVIQVHPELTTDSEIPRQWMKAWISEMELDLGKALANGSVGK